MIVNEAFAKKFFNGANPVGKTLRQPPFPGREGSTHEVVGYVQDAVYRSVRQAVPPTMYLPVAQTPGAAIVHQLERAGGRRIAGAPDQAARGGDRRSEWRSTDYLPSAR